jgi:hypothetical protein
MEMIPSRVWRSAAQQQQSLAHMPNDERLVRRQALDERDVKVRTSLFYLFFGR